MRKELLDGVVKLLERVSRINVPMRGHSVELGEGFARNMIAEASSYLVALDYEKRRCSAGRCLTVPVHNRTDGVVYTCFVCGFEWDF